LGADQAISDETVEAAARAIYAAGWEDGVPDTCATWEQLCDDDREDYTRNAVEALRAAVPHIEAAIRQKIAAEIEKLYAYEGDREDAEFNNGVRFAASAARGGSR
jgi:hypothetical protein